MESQTKKAVVIVAGGSGKRMGAEMPKQFLELAGKPVLMHTINKFYHFDQRMQIVLVLPFDHIETWNRLCNEHRFTIAHKIVPGGDERFFSVKKGLAKVSENNLVAIHDGVRPLVSDEVIANTFLAAEKHGGAIPVISPSESIRQKTVDGSKPVNRDQYVLVQTPQVFKSELIKQAYQHPYQKKFTDDATVFEAAGHTIHLVEGNIENIKITRPVDLVFVEAIFDMGSSYLLNDAKLIGDDLLFC
jgi:2-C-methyl-D-erythritol 4-phosphate cytidylyltransferase